MELLCLLPFDMHPTKIMYASNRSKKAKFLLDLSPNLDEMQIPFIIIFFEDDRIHIKKKKLIVEKFFQESILIQFKASLLTHKERPNNNIYNSLKEFFVI